MFKYDSYDVVVQSAHTCKLYKHTQLCMQACPDVHTHTHTHTQTHPRTKTQTHTYLYTLKYTNGEIKSKKIQIWEKSAS